MVRRTTGWCAAHSIYSIHCVDTMPGRSVAVRGAPAARCTAFRTVHAGGWVSVLQHFLPAAWGRCTRSVAHAHARCAAAPLLPTHTIATPLLPFWTTPTTRWTTNLPRPLTTVGLNNRGTLTPHACAYHWPAASPPPTLPTHHPTPTPRPPTPSRATAPTPTFHTLHAHHTPALFSRHTPHLLAATPTPPPCPPLGLPGQVRPRTASPQTAGPNSVAQLLWIVGTGCYLFYTTHCTTARRCWLGFVYAGSAR